MEVTARDADDVHRISESYSTGPYANDPSDLDTVIDVHLTDVDLAFLRENQLLIVRDPTVENGIMVGAPTSNTEGGLVLARDDDVTAKFVMTENHADRIESGRRDPTVYSAAHDDGRGDSEKGTIVRFLHESE